MNEKRQYESSETTMAEMMIDRAMLLTESDEIGEEAGGGPQAKEHFGDDTPWGDAWAEERQGMRGSMYETLWE